MGGQGHQHEAAVNGQRAAIGSLLAAPFAVFIAVLLVSPPMAGTMAGTAVGRFTDPVLIVALVGGVVIGATNRKWWIAPVFGLLPAIVGVTMAFSFWRRVAGEAAANREALLIVFWAVCLAMYGFLAGKIFR